jgi:hypothetical protein
MSDAASTAGKQRGRPFRPGQSGNPAGRRRGSRHKATLAMEALFEGEADAIGRKAIEKAKEGDPTALRLCLERILPARKDRPVTFAMPNLETAADAVRATSAIAQAVAEGELTPSEAGELSRLIESFTRAVEVHDLEVRLTKLEQATGALR